MTPSFTRRTLIPAIGCICASCLSGVAEEKEEEGPLSAMKMLADESVLNNIIVPQYDDKLRLSSVLRAARVKRINEDTLKAIKVNIEFYHTDQTLRGNILMGDAVLEDHSNLRSNKPVSLSSGDLSANGQGLIYDIEKERGFLFGPATASTILDNRTSMNTSPTYRFAATGIMMMAASALNAEGLNALNDQEIKELDELTKSKSGEIASTTIAIEKQIEKDTAESEAADEEVAKFLDEAGIEPVATDGENGDSKPVPGPEPLKTDEFLATVDAKKGIYFDSQKGLLVFLEDVKVDHPEFNLTGANEAKVILEKKEEKKPKPEEDKGEDNNQGSPEVNKDGKDKNKDESMFSGPKFGDPTRIVATGVVVIEKKKTGPNSKTAKASGHEISLDLKTNELIIRGGNPWIISEGASGQIIDPDGYIRMNVKTGDASFVGQTRALLTEGAKSKDNN